MIDKYVRVLDHYSISMQSLRLVVINKVLSRVLCLVGELNEVVSLLLSPSWMHFRCFGGELGSSDYRVVEVVVVCMILVLVKYICV